MSASNSFADADYLESEASVLLAHSHAACRLSLITKNQSYRLDSALKTVLLGLKTGRIETDPATPVPSPEEFLATQVLQALDSELHSIARQMAVTVARAAAFAGAMTITDFHATEFSVERITVPEDDYGDAFDGAYRQVRLCEAKFPRFAEKLAVCAFDTERLEREAAQGAMLVPDIIDWCERQGIDPDAASSVARRCWAEARSRQVPLTKLPRETFESIIGPVLAEQNPGRPLSCIRGIHLILDAHGSVESRKQIGGTSTKRVREQLRNVQIEIQRLQDAVGD
ncbi:MAG: hypothetical protein IJG77_02540 [Aeriscardovia sp.]|nr:hypothetical protein [Aeriscardovia sp.]